MLEPKKPKPSEGLGLFHAVPNRGRRGESGRGQPAALGAVGPGCGAPSHGSARAQTPLPSCEAASIPTTWPEPCGEKQTNRFVGLRSSGRAMFFPLTSRSQKKRARLHVTGASAVMASAGRKEERKEGRGVKAPQAHFWHPRHVFCTPRGDFCGIQAPWALMSPPVRVKAAATRTHARTQAKLARNPKSTFHKQKLSNRRARIHRREPT